MSSPAALPLVLLAAGLGVVGRVDAATPATRVLGRELARTLAVMKGAPGGARRVAQLKTAIDGVFRARDNVFAFTQAPGEQRIHIHGVTRPGAPLPTWEGWVNVTTGAGGAVRAVEVERFTGQPGTPSFGTGILKIELDTTTANQRWDVTRRTLRPLLRSGPP